MLLQLAVVIVPFHAISHHRTLSLALTATEAESIGVTCITTTTNIPAKIESLRYSRHLNADKISNIIHTISDSSTLSPYEIKTLMVACIDAQSIVLLTKLMEIYASKKYVSSELLFIGIKLSLKKCQWTCSNYLLILSLKEGFFIDIETIANVIKLLTRHSKLYESWHLLQQVHKVSVETCDIDIYVSVISCAAKLKQRDIMMKVFSLIEHKNTVGNSSSNSNSNRSGNGNMKVSEDIFLSAMSSCSFAGDFISTMSLFSLYRRIHGTLHLKAYSLLLMSHILYHKNHHQQQQQQPRNDRLFIELSNNLDSIVNFLIQSDIDLSSSTVSNLILQYYCVLGNLDKSHNYLQRLNNKGDMFVGTITMMDYTSLICSKKDIDKGKSLYSSLLEKKYLPSYELCELLSIQ